MLMLMASQLYEDWKGFFAKRLLSGGRFSLTSAYSEGDVKVEVYSALKNNLQTTIEVGYFSSETLFYVHIFNPQTPGNNRRQKIEYLYKYEFDSQKQYGPPGLDFEEINIAGINKYLTQGFNGKEMVYYKQKKLVKSRVTTSYYPDSPSHTTTYYFHQKSIFQRLLNKLFGRDEQFDEIKEVDLKNVFSGLKEDD